MITFRTRSLEDSVGPEKGVVWLGQSMPKDARGPPQLWMFLYHRVEQ